MNIHLIVVGRLKKGPEQQLIDTFTKRIPWPFQITEVEEKRPITGPERMAREGQLLLKAIPDKSTIILMDERGKTMRSTAFAQKIRDFEEQGVSNLVFLIGGADGFSPEVREKANLKLSLGDMTWPHMFARMMLVEQIYRASTILSGHPYHKD